MRIRIVTAATALALTVGAGVATAAVVVYSNDFSSREEFRALKKFEGGKSCKKFWRGKKTFGAEVKKGPRQCDFRTPVTGDGKEPDHEIEAAARLLKATAKGVREDAYVGVAVRADQSSRYELRVFPDARHWELRRRPDRPDFPMQGDNQSIGRVGKSNELKLRAFGDRISAFVNDTRLLPEYTDPNPSQLNGRRTMIVAGTASNSRKGAEASFSDVRIRLP